jgi:hypothetical protein
MSWKELLANRQVQPHKTSPREIEDLRRLVTRDLADAGLEGLSADRRFATAYNAVLQIAKMAIACAGYRVMSGSGHHQSTLEQVSRRNRNSGCGQACRACLVLQRRKDPDIESVEGLFCEDWET